MKTLAFPSSGDPFGLRGGHGGYEGGVELQLPVDHQFRRGFAQTVRCGTHLVDSRMRRTARSRKGQHRDPRHPARQRRERARRLRGDYSQFSGIRIDDEPAIGKIRAP